MKKQFIVEAIILAVGIAMMGFLVMTGLKYFSQGQRGVTVKGLSEIEVPADKVTWPLMYKDVGNDLEELYARIQKKNDIIVAFLKDKGITAEEISFSAPSIVDNQADRYRSEEFTYRYIITSVITVTSTKVDLVRGLITQQVDLLKQGVALTGDDYQYQVNYSFMGLNEIKPQMIEEATKNARQAALKFAEDSDSDLGKIKRAYQGQFSITDRDANTPYIKVVRVVNTIDYYLKD